MTDKLIKNDNNVVYIRNNWEKILEEKGSMFFEKPPSIKVQVRIDELIAEGKLTIDAIQNVGQQSVMLKWVKPEDRKPLNISIQQHSEAERIAKAMLKVYDMEPMQVKSKHPELWEILLDIEAGGAENAR